MRGHVQKKGDTWYVVLELERSSEGKRQTKWINVRKELGLPKPASKTQAEKLLVAKLKELNDGVYVVPTDMTVEELLTRWVRDYGKTNWRENTLNSYQSFIDKHIVPEIGKIELTKLKPMYLQQLYAKKLAGGRADGKEGGLSSRSVRYIHQIINEALTMAVRWELIARNVAEAVVPPKLVAERPQVWSHEQVITFLRSIAEHRLYPLYLLALASGMRRGEILGLRWQDIDWDRRALSVSQALVATKGKSKISDPKTDSSRRLISLSPSVVAALRKHRRQQRQDVMLIGKPEAAGGLVFLSERGTPINPRNLLRHFQKAAEDAKVPVIPFHDLRHTSATLMLQEGIHPKVVAERLGHSRINTTLDIYSHVLPAMQEDAADRMDKYLDVRRREEGEEMDSGTGK